MIQSHQFPKTTNLIGIKQEMKYRRRNYSSNINMQAIALIASTVTTSYYIESGKNSNESKKGSNFNRIVHVLLRHFKWEFLYLVYDLGNHHETGVTIRQSNRVIFAMGNGTEDVIASDI